MLQRQGEHPLRDARHGLRQLTETQRPAAECADHQQTPLVPDAVEYLPDRSAFGYARDLPCDLRHTEAAFLDAYIGVPFVAAPTLTHDVPTHK
ncbi:hypothetical protein MTY59_20880 [Mycobacterium senriense]|uniref:Uncharacterized protein n=1 Tax=Mycobacterium senriense TaxID=2775496 RepID=A0ABN6IH80_9MYCO|nr:hypothetical protein MTY59_20880 [Mycobacterium senriense]